MPLVLGLYGNPDAGSCWVAWNDEKMKGMGFRRIDGRPGCYTHPNDGLFMAACVDDFKLVGTVGAVKRMWTRIADVVKIEPPSPMER